MMKITIHQSESGDIEVYDDSDDSIDQCCDRLTELMKMGNIAILKTSTSHVVLRPSKIVSIRVEDSPNSQDVIQPEESLDKEPVEDIITDVDA